MQVLKTIGKSTALLAASAVFWAVVGATFGGGMLTADPVIGAWIGRATFWNLLAVFLCPFLLAAVQTRATLNDIKRFGVAFVFMAVPLLICLAMKPSDPRVGSFSLNWTVAGLIVNALLAGLATILSRTGAPIEE